MAFLTDLWKRLRGEATEGYRPRPEDDPAYRPAKPERPEHITGGPPAITAQPVSQAWPTPPSPQQRVQQRAQQRTKERKARLGKPQRKQTDVHTAAERAQQRTKERKARLGKPQRGGMEERKPEQPNVQLPGGGDMEERKPGQPNVQLPGGGDNAKLLEGIKTLLVEQQSNLVQELTTVIKDNTGYA